MCKTTAKLPVALVIVVVFICQEKTTENNGQELTPSLKVRKDYCLNEYECLRYVE